MTAWAAAPAAVDDSRLAQAAAALARDVLVTGVQVWRAVADPSHAANPEARLRPGGDSRIEAALVVDCMREQAGCALEGRVGDALRSSIEEKATDGEKTGEANTYRLLGAWVKPDPTAD